MSTLNLYTPTKYVLNNEAGKTKNTGLLLNFINSKDLASYTQTYTDNLSFLSTSTSGYSQSLTDFSRFVVSRDAYNPNYQNLVTKPFLSQNMRPFTMAGVANAQIDTAVFVNATASGTIRVCFASNYTGASVTVRLASDTSYTNTYSRTITGSSVNVGTTANPLFITTDLSDISQWTVTGTPDASNIIRSRIISVNSTTTNKVTPLTLEFANNYGQLVGTHHSYKFCCVDMFNLMREMETAELMCGRSVVGVTPTKDMFSVEIESTEQSMDFWAYSAGTVISNEKRDIVVHLPGFEVGNINNKIVEDVVGNPTRGQIQLAPNLRIANISIDCATLQSVQYSTAITTEADIRLGKGQYSYDSATGMMYFNTGNITKAPEIYIYKLEGVDLIAPTPNQLGERVAMQVQVQGEDGRILGYNLKKVQLIYPEFSSEEEGMKQSLTMNVFFAKKGDVEIYKF